MPIKSINNIKQYNKLGSDDKRWYSSIKDKINNLPQGYGNIELVVKVKANKVVSIDYISKGSENIG